MPRTALVFLAALLLSPVGVGAPLKRKTEPAPQLSAPVTYRDLMLVLVTKDGVAAVTFANPDPDGSAVDYTFRYESADGTKKLADTGKLFERKTPQGGYDPDGLSIVAGPVTVTWSMGGPDRG